MPPKKKAKLHHDAAPYTLVTAARNTIFRITMFYTFCKTALQSEWKNIKFFKLPQHETLRRHQLPPYQIINGNLFCTFFILEKSPSIAIASFVSLSLHWQTPTSALDSMHISVASFTALPMRIWVAPISIYSQHDVLLVLHAQGHEQFKLVSFNTNAKRERSSVKSMLKQVAMKLKNAQFTMHQQIYLYFVVHSNLFRVSVLHSHAQQMPEIMCDTIPIVCRCMCSDNLKHLILVTSELVHVFDTSLQAVVKSVDHDWKLDSENRDRYAASCAFALGCLYFVDECGSFHSMELLNIVANSFAFPHTSFCDVLFV